MAPSWKSSIIDVESYSNWDIGLISAAQNYTPVKDASFSSYASLRIRGEILDYLRKIQVYIVNY